MRPFFEPGGFGNGSRSAPPCGSGGNGALLGDGRSHGSLSRMYHSGRCRRYDVDLLNLEQRRGLLEELFHVAIFAFHRAEMYRKGLDGPIATPGRIDYHLSPCRLRTNVLGRHAVNPDFLRLLHRIAGITHKLQHARLDCSRCPSVVWRCAIVSDESAACSQNYMPILDETFDITSSEELADRNIVQPLPAKIPPLPLPTSQHGRPPSSLALPQSRSIRFSSPCEYQLRCR